MSVNNKFDDTLFEILKECKVLPTFFDVVFGFLKRRSDFYIIANEKDSPVGLPPGVSENIVKQMFYKWSSSNIDDTHPLDKEITTKHPSVSKEKPPDKIFTSSDCYNGALYENYSWSQSISEVDIFVKIPENINTKQLSVVISAQQISVTLKSSGHAFLKGELCHKVKHHDAIWSLDKTKLELHLEKASEVWWDCLVKSESRLDITKIDCSRPFEDLPQEAQAKIEELTWNQERKRLGLATSDQMDMENKLRTAWNAEGSPFSGPFDPDSVIMN